MRVLVLAVMAAACTLPGTDTGATDGPGTDPTTGDPTDKVTVTDCTAVVTDISPFDNAPSIPLNTEVVATFSEPVVDGAYLISVKGAKGQATLSRNGLVATWVSDTDLEVDTTYTVEAQVCSNVVTSSFTTVGPPVTKIDVEGNTYGLDWGDLTFLDPPRGGSLLAGSVEFDEVLFQFVSIDDTTEEATVGATVSVDDKAGAPEPFCGAYLEETADFSTNPFFAFGPQDVAYPAFFDKAGNVTGTIDIEELELNFEVSADGTKLLNPVLSGLIPTEPLLGDACEDSVLIALAKGTCTKCAAAPSGKCLMVEATAKEAALVAGFDLASECAAP